MEKYLLKEQEDAVQGGIFFGILSGLFSVNKKNYSFSWLYCLKKIQDSCISKLFQIHKIDVSMNNWRKYNLLS